MLHVAANYFLAVLWQNDPMLDYSSCAGEGWCVHLCGRIPGLMARLKGSGVYCLKNWGYPDLGVGPFFFWF